jgi:hypothetical protein
MPADFSHGKSYKPEKGEVPEHKFLVKTYKFKQVTILYRYHNFHSIVRKQGGDIEFKAPSWLIIIAFKFMVS